MSRKAYFTGEGYLASTAKISPFDNFEGGLNFRTLQPSGLLFYHGEGVNSHKSTSVALSSKVCLLQLNVFVVSICSRMSSASPWRTDKWC